MTSLKNFFNPKKTCKYLQISLETQLKFEKKILSKLSIKHNSSSTSYNINIINNIIYNEKSHIVATFKDYLIIDDVSEFLKRFYKFEESIIRLPKFFEYYDTYSKIYPNYTAIFEGKYIYRNIQKKQRMIDLQEQMEMNHNANNFNENNNVFDTDVFNSILNVTNKEDMELLFNINRDNFIQDEQNFVQKILDIVDTIEKYENQNNNDFSNINIECKSPNNINKRKNYNNNNLLYLYNRNNVNKTLKKYSNNNNSNSNSLINSNSSNNFFNLNNLSKFLSKNSATNSKNIFNLYNTKNIFNNSNFTDRALIERIEINLHKLTKKNSMYRNKSSSINKEKNLNNSKSISISKNNISIYTKKLMNSTKYSTIRQSSSNTSKNNNNNFKNYKHSLSGKKKTKISISII